MPETPATSYSGSWRHRSTYPALRIAVLYLAFATLWIVGSDRVVEAMVGDLQTATTVQSVKGLLFVFLSGALLYILIARELKRRWRVETALRLAYEREHEAVRCLREVDELKQRFLTAVSHELRTPLTSIVGFAHTLTDRPGEADEHSQAALEAVRRNALKLQNQIEDLLDTKQLLGASTPPTRETVELRPIVEDAVARFAEADSPIEVEAEPVTAAVEVEMFSGIVEQLVENAVRHTPEGTPIKVALRCEDGTVHLEVVDSGPGLPEEVMGSLFEPLQPGTTRPETPGLGVGLFLAARYTALHSGRISAANATDGGTVFRVRLPQTLPDAHRRSDVPSLAGATVGRSDGTSTIERLAKVVRLGSTSQSADAALTKRRRELTALLLFGLLAIPLLLALSFVEPFSAGGLGSGKVAPWVTRTLIVLFAVAFALYVVEKERAIRGLTHALGEERSLTQTLESRVEQLASETAGPEERSACSAVAERLAVEAAGLLNAEHASLMVPERGGLVVIAEAGEHRRLQGRRQEIAEGVAGYVARTRKPLLLRDDLDVIEAAADLGISRGEASAPVRSSVCVPVLSDNEVSAVLNANLLWQDRSFDGDDLRTLTLFAEEASRLFPLRLEPKAPPTDCDGAMWQTGSRNRGQGSVDRKG